MGGDYLNFGKCYIAIIDERSLRSEEKYRVLVSVL